MNKIYKNIQIKKDGSFITEKDGLPYHIPNIDEFKEEYNLINQYVHNNPSECSNYDEPMDLPTIEEKAEIERYKRNQLLNDVDTMLIKYTEQVELGIIPAIEDYRVDLLKYKQALRDIPEQTDFPENIKYPELPKYEDY